MPIPEVAGFLADTEAVVRKHYFKWTPEYQARQDAALRLVHGTGATATATPTASC